MIAHMCHLFICQTCDCALILRRNILSSCAYQMPISKPKTWSFMHSSYIITINQRVPRNPISNKQWFYHWVKNDCVLFHVPVAIRDLFSILSQRLQNDRDHYIIWIRTVYASVHTVKIYKYNVLFTQNNLYLCDKIWTAHVLSALCFPGAILQLLLFRSKSSVKIAINAQKE